MILPLSAEPEAAAEDGRDETAVWTEGTAPATSLTQPWLHHHRSVWGLHTLAFFITSLHLYNLHPCTTAGICLSGGCPGRPRLTMTCKHTLSWSSVSMTILYYIIDVLKNAGADWPKWSSVNPDCSSSMSVCVSQSTSKLNNITFPFKLKNFKLCLSNSAF